MKKKKKKKEGKRKGWGSFIIIIIIVIIIIIIITQLGDGTALGAEDAGAPPLPLPIPTPLLLALAGGVPGAELPQTLAAEGVGARQQHRLLEQFQTDGAGQLLRHARGGGHITSRHATSAHVDSVTDVRS